jgi:hypothetical protein
MADDRQPAPARDDQERQPKGKPLPEPKDGGYGRSHGYPPGHGGPTGPGDAPALPKGDPK